ncbi:Hypothetical predicted protein [Pelobates cultripes]|uniref:Uncharacterized protein n=1 Tax=Pelobates cultripes TaxID=61616 RepID=A0AAD1R626_PELCU|nr:Hypothetical predicted protein [Pelobates cultripes]
MRHPHSVEKRIDLLSRLNKIFDNFWQKLEDRRHQTDPAQPQVHSPQQQIAPPQRTPTAWRGRRLPSLRQRMARKRKLLQAKARTQSAQEAPEVA